jgi:hypothetical protein
MTTSWKWVLAVFLGLVVVILCVLSYIVGAASAAQDAEGFVVNLPNGEEVMCVTTERGSISCNWFMVTG